MLKHLYSLQLGPTFIDQSLELAQGASVWKASGQFKSHTNLTPGLLVGGCCEKVNGLSSAVFEDTKVQSELHFLLFLPQQRLAHCKIQKKNSSEGGLRNLMLLFNKGAEVETP